MIKPLVLIVEDEAALVTMLRYNLEKEGFAVCEAGDGEEALIQIAERKPDLVLLDWMLPLVSGIEVCRRIRRSPDTRSLPVIMLSGASGTPTVVEAMKKGATDFLAKPVGHAELRTAVQNALGNATRHEPEIREVQSKPAGTAPYHGRGTWLRKMESFVDRVGACDAPVLVQGETGVGKEVLARMLHARCSPKATGVAVPSLTAPFGLCTWEITDEVVSCTGFTDCGPGSGGMWLKFESGQHQRKLDATPLSNGNPHWRCAASTPRVWLRIVCKWVDIYSDQYL